MNATSIWAGSDYALIPNRGRSERFSLKAHRVKAWRVMKEREPGNKNDTTFVVVEFVDRDTGEVIDFQPGYYDARVIVKMADGKFKVRAYDLVENWDNVAMHYRQLIAEQREREREREEREARWQQERERARLERESRVASVRQFLNNRGITNDMIKYITDTDIALHSHAIIAAIVEQEGTLRDASTI